MKSRAQLDTELDNLAGMLPPWLQHLRHEAQFWPQFNALAKEILDQAGDEDIQYVVGRLDSMLKTHVPVTLDHAFPVCSLSKLLASTLVMQLSESGDVDLQAPAGNYVRDLPTQWRHIPVRDFLNHTSGVPEYVNATQYQNTPGHVEYPQELKTLFASLADTPLQSPSGSDTRYTQTNYLVLSALLSEHYGKPYTQIAEERILRPLGMTSSWFGPDTPPGTPSVVS